MFTSTLGYIKHLQDEVAACKDAIDGYTEICQQICAKLDVDDMEKAIQKIDTILATVPGVETNNQDPA